MMEIRSHIIPYIQMWACGPAAGKVEYVLNYCTLGSYYNLTLSKPFTPHGVRADRDLSSMTSIKATTAIRAATGTAPLGHIVRATSEL